MPILRTLVLTVILTGCAVTAKPPGEIDETQEAAAESTGDPGSAAKYRYVGTYEHFATPMGSSVSVLMADGNKIKIVSVDDTDYTNIALNNGIPEMRISGTYGINGEFRKSPHSPGEVFIVREIGHLGGGQDPVSARKRQVLPDFFTVDGDAHGPLTLSELQIDFPDSLARYFDKEARDCFYRQVELRADDLGDPVTMPPIRRVLITNSQWRWAEMTNTDKRLQAARYVTSMALSDC